MIQLTEKLTRLNKKGEEIDATIYLDRLDSNNLVIKEGEKVLNYFGDVRTALRVSLNYAIKVPKVALSLENMLSVIDGIDKNIKELRIDCMEETK